MEVISQVASSIFIREAMTASKRPSGLLSVDIASQEACWEGQWSLISSQSHAPVPPANCIYFCPNSTKPQSLGGAKTDSGWVTEEGAPLVQLWG